MAILTHKQRFAEALELLVGKKAPDKLISDWVDNIQYDNDLQQWVGNNGGFWWVQNIAILDACEVMARNPIEGEPELIEYES